MREFLSPDGEPLTRRRQFIKDHEVVFRSDGQERVLHISARLQIAVMMVLAALFSIGLAYQFLDLSPANAAARTVDAPKPLSETERIAIKLEYRQDVLDSMASQYFDVVTIGSGARTGLEGADLSEIERRQREFADNVASAATDKTRDTEAMIRKLGIDPRRLRRDGGAVGGPFVAVPAERGLGANGLGTSGLAADPSLRRLHKALVKLDAIERLAMAMPSSLPTSPIRLSSPFGIRADPFNGAAAMHQGLDFVGDHGQAIFAAGGGTVRVAGYEPGYGNVVMIDHGNGIESRYGHLSGFDCYSGQKIAPGQKIGRMGSTGRSTGTHLHFEVRLNGQAINPRPFIEASAEFALLKAKAARRLGVPARKG